MSAHAAPPRLTLPLGASVLLHGAVITALFLFRPPPPALLPPVYRVNLIAAPAGPRAIGTVQDKPSEPATKPVTPPRSKARPKPAPVVEKKAAKPAPARKVATPAPAEVKTKRADAKTPAAGGGPEGGKGADVANVNTPGIAFPFQGYLDNIVRQIALRFSPGGGTALTAEVAFLVHRDGTVTDFRFQKRSGSYAFDLAAQGAIDAAGSARAFGALPSAYPNDVLPVIFTFDPRLIH
ncbi:MAG: TonB C-terminal domain-containing protein [Gemmatimonadota bacterium]|nr:TonB C-terminal domain-containing protein [Gemmatimonadota bacterium]